MKKETSALLIGLGMLFGGCASTSRISAHNDYMAYKTQKPVWTVSPFTPGYDSTVTGYMFAKNARLVLEIQGDLDEEKILAARQTVREKNILPPDLADLFKSHNGHIVARLLSENEVEIASLERWPGEEYCTLYTPVTGREHCTVDYGLNVISSYINTRWNSKIQIEQGYQPRR